MRICLKNLGCRVNEAELEAWARDFQARGYLIVDVEETADIVIVNTCAVTQDAVRKSKNVLRRIVRNNPNSKTVLSGCYATLDSEEIQYLGADLIIHNNHKHRLTQIVQDTFGVSHFLSTDTFDTTSSLFRRGRHRAFIKVQDGCRHRCTYCIVTVARGEERSKPIDTVLSEIYAVQAEGVQEVVLTGVHLGGYGCERNLHLADLIRIIIANTDIPRIRLGSLEPWDIPDTFIRLFENGRLMPHLHLPMQSGSDTVLKRMARRGRTVEFKRLVDSLRQVVSDLHISTDILVGFPGETEKEWSETLAFVEEIGFGQVHIFRFSARTGTAAAEYPLPISGEVKKTRSQALRERVEQHKQAWCKQFIGREFPVLWEGVKKNEQGQCEIVGYTPNYLRVSLSLEGPTSDLSYRIIPARLTGLTPVGDFSVDLLN